MHAMTKPQLFELFDKISAFSTTAQDDGVTRLAYSETDEAAHQFFIAELQRFGLAVRQDPMGNIFARLPGKEPDLPPVATGSHLDSVPNGGAYDGVLGVLMGLYAISQFKPNSLKRSLELIVFRAEESSRFGFACMGSKAMTGMVDLAKWRNNTDNDGMNFFAALQANGYDASRLNQCVLSQTAYYAFIEAHIEQGSVLENAHKTIGLVTGIAAPSRFKVNVIGQADHSGATPMTQRHDALVASAAIISSLYQHALVESVYGTVATVGKLDVAPNAMNVIPGKVQFFVDIRGVDVPSIDRIVEQLYKQISQTETEFAVKIELQALGRDTPVLLDEQLITILEGICDHQQIKYQRIISGAGHDAMYMAKHFPSCMIFTPSQLGVSHHPQEFTDNQDISIAADLLTTALEKFANAE